EHLSNKIGRITPSGMITEFPIPTADSGPTGIALGRDGNIWFAELHNPVIGRITPAGTITEFPLSAAARPFGLAAGTDGNLWFTDRQGRIGRVSVNGTAVEIPLPAGVSSPTLIAVGPDGNLWFTDIVADKVVRITLPAFAQIAVYRGSTGEWFIHRSSDGG